ncbi:hypothetical protein [Salinispora arenicola]|nr:hypothetical protein [Salinispora arenicola]
MVLGLEGDVVRMHDPRGFPYATLPVDSLLSLVLREGPAVPVRS